MPKTVDNQRALLLQLPKGMTNTRKHNQPPVPPRALTDEDVAAIDYMVHALGARQWKVAVRIGCSERTVMNALHRTGAYANVPAYASNA